jgi:hypothetical protein
MTDYTKTQHLTPRYNPKNWIYCLRQSAFKESGELTETNFLDFLKNILVNKFYKQKKHNILVARDKWLLVTEVELAAKSIRPVGFG